MNRPGFRSDETLNRIEVELDKAVCNFEASIMLFFVLCVITLFILSLAAAVKNDLSRDLKNLDELPQPCVFSWLTDFHFVALNDGEKPMIQIIAKCRGMWELVDADVVEFGNRVPQFVIHVNDYCIAKIKISLVMFTKCLIHC
uniref:Uncharacterized protein n=1 Tax=Ditylenchus dipsaci TaxID=166011 RepID=A0A915D4B7_9BILA